MKTPYEAEIDLTDKSPEMIETQLGRCMMSLMRVGAKIFSTSRPNEDTLVLHGEEEPSDAEHFEALALEARKDHRIADAIKYENEAEKCRGVE